MNNGVVGPGFSVLDYGAKGDGAALDTGAIQSAIDACTQAGGGTVILPSGTYLSGTIQLKNNVTLYLAADAKLLGSTNLAHYPDLYGRDETYGSNAFCLIAAANVENVGLAGQGIVDGQGSAFPYGSEGFNFEDEAVAPTAVSYIRPLLVRMLRCRKVTLDGLTLQHAASWCCHLENCTSLRIDGVHIFNRANQNNDGFDLTSCEDVVVSNCHVDCGDDAFALKEGGIRIAITNCIISTRWAAFRVGPEARGVFRDIVVSNCVVYNTYGSGIKMQQVEGGVMENILFDNMLMENVTGPISIRLGGYLGWKNERKESLPIGVFRNVQFSNIRARVAENADALPHEVPAFPGERKSCINITGVPGYYLEGVTLSNIHVTFPGGGTQEEAHREVPELRDHYPEYHMFGILPAYGMYVRHARGLVCSNLQLDAASPDRRPALVCDDVQDLELAQFRATGPAGGELIRLKNARNVFIHGSRPLSEVEVFVRVEGSGSEGILLTANDTRKAARSVELGEGATQDAVTQ